MSDNAPLVDAMKRIRTWPLPSDQQAAFIDMLIEAHLMGLYPGPEWVIHLMRDSRTIHVSRWTPVPSGDMQMWSLVSDSIRDVSCEELERAGEGWLALAKSQMP